MQATGRYDRETGGPAGARRAGGVSRTGDPPSEPAVAATVHEQYVPRAMLRIWSARGTCPVRIGIDAPILRDRDSDGDGETGDYGADGSGLDERLYYLTDAHMNVTAVTNTTGAVVERYHYDPYGHVTILDGTTDSQTEWAPDADQVSDVANEVLYCGYRRDPETGLYHVRHRTYHPHLARWLQRDPIGYVDGMSLYEYCGGAPVGLLDPSGNAVCVALEIMFGQSHVAPKPWFGPLGNPTGSLARPWAPTLTRPIPIPSSIPAPPIAIPMDGDIGLSHSGKKNPDGSPKEKGQQGEEMERRIRDSRRGKGPKEDGHDGKKSSQDWDQDLENLRRFHNERGGDNPLVFPANTDPVTGDAGGPVLEKLKPPASVELLGRGGLLSGDAYQVFPTGAYVDGGDGGGSGTVVLIKPMQ